VQRIEKFCNTVLDTKLLFTTLHNFTRTDEVLYVDRTVTSSSATQWSVSGSFEITFSIQIIVAALLIISLELTKFYMYLRNVTSSSATQCSVPRSFAIPFSIQNYFSLRSNNFTRTDEVLYVDRTVTSSSATQCSVSRSF